MILGILEYHPFNCIFKKYAFNFILELLVFLYKYDRVIFIHMNRPLSPLHQFVNVQLTI